MNYSNSNNNTTPPETFNFEKINQKERPFSSCLLRELRSDHAGEMGAVWIYRGGLVGSFLNPFCWGLREGIVEHLEAEKVHLNGLAAILTLREKSLLTPLWLIMGFGLGLISSLLGPAVFNAMVEGVETYVDEHYEGQIQYILAYNEACKQGVLPPTSLSNLTLSTTSSPSSPPLHPHHELLRFLKKCQADEVDHRDDAHEALLKMKYIPINPPKTPSKTPQNGGVFQSFLVFWGWLADVGSRCAVAIARRI